MIDSRRDGNVDVSESRRFSRVTTYWPLAVGVLATALVLGWVLQQVFRVTGGRVIYALDDPYIHMSIARSLATHGVWGIDPDQFAPASSSPLWTLLLAAAYSVTGVHEPTALVLNLMAVCGLLVLVFVLASHAGVSSAATAALLVSVSWLTPLAVLAISGMEHVVQILVDLAFMACAVEAIRSDATHRQRFQKLTWCLAPLVTGIRYEGMFIVSAVCLLMALRRRWFEAFTLGVMGALPIVAFGVFSLAHGGFFLPNSVLIKAQSVGALPAALSLHAIFASAIRPLWMMSSTPYLLPLTLPSSFLLLWGVLDGKVWSPRVLWNAIYMSTVLMHMQVGGIGFFFRYEAYLVAMGLVVVVTTAVPRPAMFVPSRGVDRWPYLAAVALVAVVLLSPIVWRAYVATSDAARAVANVYQQQYQMGLFVRAFYGGRAVALNDIGAVSFLARSRVIDLAGLADMDTARAIRAHQLDAGFIEARVRRGDATIAILYDAWFSKSLPSGWVRVGQWTIPNRVSVAGDTVSFYAINHEEAEKLAANLRSYSMVLPESVVQRGPFIDAPTIQRVPAGP